MKQSENVSNVDLLKARDKYRIERDKRISAGASGRGAADLVGDLRHYLDDPFMKPSQREPLFDEVDVVVVGAGFAGLLVGAHMKEAGFKRVRLIDSAGDVGGVWYWNRYPEAKCDVESLIYMPLLEETGYVPTMKYAAAPEIGEHARRIARQYKLYDHALFHTTVTRNMWNEESSKWHIQTDRGDEIRAKFVVLCLGPMNRVKLADIPGVDSFKGKAFHTSRWDYQYTGGDPTNPDLDRLRDKVVGFVGTGATGLQCVAPLGRSSKRLLLFQRTPSTVGVRNNGSINADEVRSFRPGWQRLRQENFTAINFGLPVDVDLVKDGWTELYGNLFASTRYTGLSGEELEAEKERVDFEMMEKIRQRVVSIVKDPKAAESLKPQYSYLCKRPGWHDEFLTAFNLPTVSLIDTNGLGVERVTEKGVIANGKEYELDCLVFGTGFESETLANVRIGIEVVGRNGLTLAEKWATGVSTLHGMTTRQFPNFFVIPAHSGQAVLTTNVVHMTQHYAEHIAYIAKSVSEQGGQAFDVSEDAEAAWVRTILERRVDQTAFLESCTPGRNNNEGKVQDRPIQNTLFGGTPNEYFAILENWRNTRKLSGLVIS